LIQSLYSNGRLLPETKHWSTGRAAGPFGGAPQDLVSAQAFAAALTALGIDPESEVGRAHLQGFRQLPAKRY
jgi:hypothetical protein